MSNCTAFVIPKGVSFEQHPEGICIEFDQDIVIKAPVGMPIKKLSSTNGNIRLEIEAEVHEISAPNGSVFLSKEMSITTCTAKSLEAQNHLDVQKITLSGSMQGFSSLSCSELHVQGSVHITGNAQLGSVEITGSARFGGDFHSTNAVLGADLTVQGDSSGTEITTKGNVRIHGSLEAEILIADDAKIICDKDVQLKLLRAKDIILKGKNNNITAIQAHNYVSISEGSLNSDVLVAQKAEIHPNTIGKIMIVDVQSPLGPHSIKGCLSPEDIAPLLPNPKQFIRQRGILLEEDEDQEEVQEAPKERTALSKNTIVSQNPISERKQEDSKKEIKVENSLSVLPMDPTAEKIQEEVSKAPFLEPISPTTPNISPTMSSQESILETFSFSHSPSTPEKSFEEELSNIIHSPDQQKEQNPSENNEHNSKRTRSAQEEEEEEEEDAPASSFHEEHITPLSEFYSNVDISDEDSEHSPPFHSEKALVVIPSASAPPIGITFEELSSEDNESSSDDLDLVPMNNIPPLASSHDGLYERLRKQADMICEDYDNEIPSSLMLMSDLIEAQQYPKLRAEIKVIWSQVLRFHQKKNTRIPGKVTMAFNEINKLLN
jgi:cytoskeletal protein CcmA (bactofilin family)